MEGFLQLMSSGALSLIDMVLIAIIGLLVYFLTIKQKDSESKLNNTVEGLHILLEEERLQTNALSKTVHEIRKEMKTEQEKNFALREEILVLKQENLRLQNLVTQMEKLVQTYQEEIKLLKQEREGV